VRFFRAPLISSEYRQSIKSNGVKKILLEKSQEAWENFT
jgi:hypothetical protein